MWFIVCQFAWMSFETKDLADRYQQSQPKTQSLRGCGQPFTMSPQDLEDAMDRQPEYHSYIHGNTQEFDDAEQAAHEVARTPSMQEFLRSSPDPVETPETKSVESPKSCHYWFVRIGPHTLKMKTSCK